MKGIFKPSLSILLNSQTNKNKNKMSAQSNVIYEYLLFVDDEWEKSRICALLEQLPSGNLLSGGFQYISYRKLLKKYYNNLNLIPTNTFCMTVLKEFSAIDAHQAREISRGFKDNGIRHTNSPIGSSAVYFGGWRSKREYPLQPQFNASWSFDLARFLPRLTLKQKSKDTLGSIFTLVEEMVEASNLGPIPEGKYLEVCKLFKTMNENVDKMAD
jgi:hypothetical protein